jgi:hypothetical protein
MMTEFVLTCLNLYTTNQSKNYIIANNCNNYTNYKTMQHWLPILTLHE